eukprot:13982102-Alexandrium_andersonii.AAC.1
MAFVARQELSIAEAAEFGPLFSPRGLLITFGGSSRRVDGQVVAGGAAVIWSPPDAAGECSELGWVP